jgi:hypothetical protein
MDLEKTIAELREESQRILEAIEALERLAQGGIRRGRPPRWLVSVREAKKSLGEEAKAEKPPKK